MGSHDGAYHECVLLTKKVDDWKFKFNGCPRLAANKWPPSLRNVGTRSYDQCAQACASQKGCNGFEVNGCMADKICANGACWTFTEDVSSIINGCPAATPAQKVYVKAKPTKAAAAKPGSKGDPLKAWQAKEKYDKKKKKDADAIGTNHLKDLHKEAREDEKNGKADHKKTEQLIKDEFKKIKE